MSNKMYDVLKWIAQLFLPALGTLYYALSNLWALPEPEKVVGTILILDSFLGALLGIAIAEYNRNPKVKASIFIEESFKQQEMPDPKFVMGIPEDTYKKIYDIVKWIALVLLPALGVAYLAFGNLWSLPYAQEVAGTITAIDIFLGTLLGISATLNKN